MTSRVDRFATLVEETGGGRHHRRPVDADRELLALVAVVHQLGREPLPTVREDFRDELHARLQAEFARETAARPTALDPAAAPYADDPARRASQEKTQVVRLVRPRVGLGARAFRPSTRARLAGVIGVATGALVLSGVSLASGDAMPGDPLYSVKRSGEQAKLVLASSDADRGRLHLEFARTRLVESRQVAPEEVAEVLAEMDRQTIEGARLLFSAGFERAERSPIDSVTAFVAQHRAELLHLRATARAPGDPARDSLDLLDNVEIRANQLRAAIVSGCTEVTIDRLGPKPAC